MKDLRGGSSTRAPGDQPGGAGSKPVLSRAEGPVLSRAEGPALRSDPRPQWRTPYRGRHLRAEDFYEPDPVLDGVTIAGYVVCAIGIVWIVARAAWALL